MNRCTTTALDLLSVWLTAPRIALITFAGQIAHWSIRDELKKLTYHTQVALLSDISELYNNLVWLYNTACDFSTLYSWMLSNSKCFTICSIIIDTEVRLLGHLFRMQELDPCRKLTVYKPEGTRRVGKPRARWLESVETDLRKTGVKNWRRQAQGREQWRAILKGAKVHRGL
jgi:hypothetical protein